MSDPLGDDDYLPFIYRGPVGAASAVLPFVATVLLGMRIYNRVQTKKGVGIDDILLVTATICCWGMGAVLLDGIRRRIIGWPEPPLPSGFSQVNDLAPGQTRLYQYQYAFWTLMILTFGLIKLSVLFLYRRIFAVNHALGVITWAAIGVSITWTVGFFFGQVLACGAQPWHYWGTLADASSHCTKGLDFLLSLAATDLATDTFIFFLPMPIIWRLHMPLRRKFLTSLIFLLGSLSLIASAFRLSIHIDHLRASYSKPADLYLTITMSFYWSMLEAGIALIAVNLPTVGDVFGDSSVQSMVRSVRSILSLRSLSPRGSQANTTVGKITDATARTASTEKPPTVAQAAQRTTTAVSAAENGVDEPTL